MELRRIVVCVDFSAITPKVLDWAGEEAKRFGAKVELVHVLEETMPRLAQEMLDLHTLYDKLKEVTVKKLDELKEEIEGKFGIEAETKILNGEPFDAILDYLEETKPDLVMVGAHGKKGVRRILLGSVSEKVARKSPVNVAIVKYLPPSEKTTGPCLSHFVGGSRGISHHAIMQNVLFPSQTLKSPFQTGSLLKNRYKS